MFRKNIYQAAWSSPQKMVWQLRSSLLSLQLLSPSHLTTNISNFAKKSPLFNRDAGPVIARELGLVAGGDDETPPVLPISADIFGYDPILWSDWKSCFVRHLKDLCVVVKGDDLPTVGTFV